MGVVIFRLKRQSGPSWSQQGVYTSSSRVLSCRTTRRILLFEAASCELQSAAFGRRQPSALRHERRCLAAPRPRGPLGALCARPPSSKSLKSAWRNGPPQPQTLAGAVVGSKLSRGLGQLWRTGAAEDTGVVAVVVRLLVVAPLGILCAAVAPVVVVYCVVLEIVYLDIRTNLREAP